MGRHRRSGPLDPLFKKLGIRLQWKFAEMLGVTRQTVNRWQKDGNISPYNQLKINMLFIARGLDPPYQRTFGRNTRLAIEEDRQKSRSHA